MTELRRIFQTKTTSHGEVRDVLQMLFANELLCPSQKIWLVSPWIGDIPILDNRTGGFDAINPEWTGREIRLSEVLTQLMSFGCFINVVTVSQEDEFTNSYFIDRMEKYAEEMGLRGQININEKRRPDFDTIGLHVKGILTDRGFLSGSMNISNKGITQNDEMIEYDINSERIAEAKSFFTKEYSDGTLEE